MRQQIIKLDEMTRNDCRIALYLVLEEDSYRIDFSTNRRQTISEEFKSRDEAVKEYNQKMSALDICTPFA